VIMAIVDTWEVDGVVKYTKVEAMTSVPGDWLDETNALAPAAGDS